MITLSRLNGPPFALNPDLIERVDATPDTVITLVDSTKYVVRESVEEVVQRVRESKAAIVALSHRMDEAAVPAKPVLRVVPDESETPGSPASQ
jgi:flagellar protein FlbD